MGRHSAPADDDEDELRSVGVASGVELAPEQSGPGRHGLDRELPSAQTRLIPVVDAEIAADADAHLAPVTGIPAAEYSPVLPGEAVVPPEPAEPADELDALDALMAPPAKPRPTPRRTRAEKNAAREQAVSAAATSEIAPLEVVPPEAVPLEAVPQEGAAPDGAASEVAALEVAPQEGAAPDGAAPEVAAPEGAPPQVASSDVAPPSTTKPPHATAADLALLRRDRSLLARVLAGLLVPFVIYAVVLVIVGAHGAQWVIWIWIPTITAGVVAGSFLDLAHKRAGDQAAAEPTEDRPLRVSGS